MKKLLVVLLSLISLVSLIGCSPKKVETLSVVCPQGAPLIAIAGVEDQALEVVNGASPLQAALTAATYDIVIAPVALGTKLYIKGASKYKIAAVITMNNTYLVCKHEFSASDLEGKTILAYGEGTAPDGVLQSYLKNHNVTASIDYVSSVSDVTAPFVKGDYEYALMAEPVISNLKIKKSLDLKTIELNGSDVLPQAAIYVNSDIIETKSASVKAYLKAVKANIEKIADDGEGYIDTIIDSQDYFTTLGSDVLKATIKNIGMCYIKARASELESYYTFINAFAPTIIGGTPDNTYYYEQ